MLFNRKKSVSSKWQKLESVQELTTILNESHHEDVVLFKHSTRCSISSMAKNRMESEMDQYSHPIYLLDLLNHRDVSNAIANELQVVHESPQLILVRNGKAIYSASHGSISMRELIKHSA
ncbi:MAG: bacillithiol system redox-active protein YtxJ [Bacteroidetes bacterium]|nr:bacillithiol system redox-active protein YtxJ [Bacteroidota bacterium]